MLVYYSVTAAVYERPSRLDGPGDLERHCPDCQGKPMPAKRWDDMTEEEQRVEIYVEALDWCPYPGLNYREKAFCKKLGILK